MKWIKQEATTWVAHAGMLRLSVHRHIHHPGSWCVSCEPFWSARPLISEALANAKEEARGMLQHALHSALEELR